MPSWFDEFKKPVTLFFIALSIVSIAVSIYLFFKAKEFREISIRLVAVTKVYDSSSTSRKLSVLDSNKDPVTNDVYVASYQLWNSGTLPIEPSDLRRAFSMSFVGDARLLDWSIPYSVSDSDVCRFRLEASDTNSSPHFLTLKWQHFDPQRGCQIQFLYAGSARSALAFESPFTGNGRVTDITQLSVWKRPRIGGYSIISFILLGVISTSALLISDFAKNLQLRRNRSWIKAQMVGWIVYLIIGVLAAWIVIPFIEVGLKTPFPPNIPVNFKSNVDIASP